MSPAMDADVETVDRGERVVARTVVVDAPATEIFALVVDPHRHHELDGSGTVRDGKVTGPHRLTTGDRFSVAMVRWGRVPYSITSTAVDVEPDRVVEWTHPGGHHWRWELEPLDAGRTRVTEVFDYRGSRAARLLELMRMPGENAQGIEATLTRLRDRFA